MIEGQDSTKALAALDWAGAVGSDGGLDEPVVQALVIPFTVVEGVVTLPRKTKFDASAIGGTPGTVAT